MPGPSLGLERITALLAALKSPHLRVPIVHVAGTNGKGSICAYVDTILRQAGLRTGRFTSPHLIEPNDCIVLNGQPAPPAIFRSHTSHVDSIAATFGASPFERLTAVAFTIFAAQQPPLHLAIIEVGVGGAEDATNVCPKPLATVLGPVDLDHQALLGDTVEEIARVKSGIFRPNCPVILAPQRHPSVEVIARQTADRKGTKLHVVPSGAWQADGTLEMSFPSREDGTSMASLRARPGLAGAYQAINAATAASVVELLRTSPSSACYEQVADQHIIDGIEQTTWPGRLSSVSLLSHSFPILVDGAHNPSAAAELRKFIDSQLPNAQTTFIVSLSAPRDPLAILRPILIDFPGARLLATQFSTPVEGMRWVKPLETSVILQAARQLGVACQEELTLAHALARVRAEERVVVCGSLYLVADLYRLARIQHAASRTDEPYLGRSMCR